MADKKQNPAVVSYILGILSIVFAFFTPLAGLILGIIGFVQSKKPRTNLLKKAKKLNIIGIILSSVLLLVSIIATAYLAIQGENILSNFPSY